MLFQALLSLTSLVPFCFVSWELCCGICLPTGMEMMEMEHLTQHHSGVRGDNIKLGKGQAVSQHPGVLGQQGRDTAWGWQLSCLSLGTDTPEGTG